MPCSKLRVCKLSKQEAQAFYAVHRGKPFYDTLTDFMSSGRICAMELVASNAIKKWRDLLGPTDSDQARKEAPNSIRANFGTNKTYNACHGSDAPDTAAQELGFFFGQGSGPGKCDLGRNTTLGIVKPHLVMDGMAGLVVDVVQDHFEVTAMQMFQLDKISSAEFYEVRQIVWWCQWLAQWLALAQWQYNCWLLWFTGYCTMESPKFRSYIHCSIL